MSRCFRGFLLVVARGHGDPVPVAHSCAAVAGGQFTGGLLKVKSESTGKWQRRKRLHLSSGPNMHGAAGKDCRGDTIRLGCLLD